MRHGDTMTRLLFSVVLLVLFSNEGIAQFTSTARHIGQYTSAPASCSTATGDIYYNTTSKVPFYCSATNTWTQFASAAAASPASPANSIQFNNAGAFGGNANAQLSNSTMGQTGLWLLDIGGYFNAYGGTIADVATDPGFDPPDSYLIGVYGGNTTIATDGTGGTGGGIQILGGNGGTAALANTSSVSGNGGNLFIGGGLGAAATATTGINTAGGGGSVTIAGGAGADASGGTMNFGGSAGNIELTLAAGGTGSTSNGSNGRILVTGAAEIFSITRAGLAKSTLFGSYTNCADSAGAAACGAAPAGAFVIDAGSTSTVVSTTAVTANSRIFLQEDSSLSTELSVTCNTQSSLTLGALRVTARTAATSFTATLEVGPTTNPMCVNYWIIN